MNNHVESNIEYCMFILNDFLNRKIHDAKAGFYVKYFANVMDISEADADFILQFGFNCGKFDVEFHFRCPDCSAVLWNATLEQYRRVQSHVYLILDCDSCDEGDIHTKRISSDSGEKFYKYIGS